MLITKELFFKINGVTLVENVALHTAKKVVYSCDYCGKETEVSFRGYYQRHKGNLKEEDYCTKCKHEMPKENRRIKRFNMYKDTLESNDFIVISKQDELRVLRTEKIKVICLNHKELGVQLISGGTVEQGYYTSKPFGCRQCKSEKISIASKEYNRGENNRNWYGGITELNKHLRRLITPWVVDSMKQCNFKCTLSGDKDWQVHHLKGFSIIVKQTLDELKLPIKPNIGDYTQQEMNDIDTKCLQLHYELLGVCLDKTLHALFHSHYGFGDNTIEQFNEFKIRYQSGV
jgi:DNA-directed RNA polymerase subunit M/transcription elongation factor TFIIS